MSRIGKQPVAVPSGVKVSVNGRDVSADGPKGKMQVTLPELIEAEYAEADNQILVKRANESKRARSFHGLGRSLVQNMVFGCAEGYSLAMELHGVGYSINVQGQRVVMQVGFNHPVHVGIVDGVTVNVEQATNPGRFTVSGCDKQKVGQTAANIRKVCPPEPYQGKGVRFVGEQIRRKAGKAFAATGG